MRPPRVALFKDMMAEFPGQRVMHCGHNEDPLFYWALQNAMDDANPLTGQPAREVQWFAACDACWLESDNDPSAIKPKAYFSLAHGAEFKEAEELFK